MSRRRAARRPDNGGRVRIIGGRWRGRQLTVSDLPGLRPTPDRLRETLFNWLAFELPGARCLDLFAGSGALGLEALSRGAATSVLIERQPQAAARLRVSIAQLEATGAELIEADGLHWLDAAPVAPFNIAFLDPPFDADLWLPACQRLIARGWLQRGALLYLEHPADTADAPPLPAELTPHRETRAGQVIGRLLRYTIA